jgi:saccharopine dehydrogenase (NAD+, L-lysine forming)
MSKVLIIGAGGVGRVVAYKCAQHPEIFSDIMLASRTKYRCDEIVRDAMRDTGHKKMQTAAVDAENVPELVQLIRSFGPELVIHVALPYQDLTIMDACLETGVHYLDTANYEPKEEAKFEYSWQWAYQDRFREKGLLAVLGCGFDPGVTSIFTAHAAKHHFDEIHYLDIVDCNAGDHGKAFATNFNPEINIREVTQKGRYYENGRWIETEPHEIFKILNYPDIGPRKSYVIYHEELESSSRIFPPSNAPAFG